VTAEITPLIAGNWKMNGTTASLAEVRKLGELLTVGEPPRCTVVICPPATLIAQLTAEASSAGIVTGGQDCHAAASGANTGDISAPMLADAGAQYVIVGHSERRRDHAETDAAVRAKAVAGMAAGLIPIICVGETEAERRAGQALNVVASQISGSVPVQGEGRGIVIAYEPVWAIGTGLTPTVADIAQMHTAIRGQLVELLGGAGAKTRILYGGSVKPSNAAEILAIADVDGALVGGASLLANDFHAIISAV
jgi:triosephosphate isomerase